MATTVVEPRAPDQQPLTGVNDINADPNAETSSILDVVRIAEIPFFSNSILVVLDQLLSG